MIKQPTLPETGQTSILPPRPAFSLENGRKELGIFLLLLALCAFVSVMSHGTFLHVDNLQNTSRLIGLYGIFSIGAGIVIITGGIDLSVGSLFALFGVLLSMMLTIWNWPWPLAVLAILSGGALIGVFHGFLITRVHLQPFIVTLCGLLFYRGIARFIAGDGTMGFGEAKGFEMLQVLATGSVLGVPVPFVLLIVVALIMGVVLHRSVYGRYLYAVGRNEEAARYSGINTRGIIAGAYVISGLLAGLAAILIGFYTNSISPSSHGQSYELYGIAAAVLGGCSLRGGEGSIVGILIGAALLQVLQNLVNLLNIPSSLNFAVVGAVILLGVITDQLLKKKGQSVKKNPPRCLHWGRLDSCKRKRWMAGSRVVGHLSGGKYTASHTTVIDAASLPAQAAARLECVSKISLGLIKTLRNGPPAIKFIDEGTGCLLVKVRGVSSIQEIRVYTTDQDAVQAAMQAAFK